METGAEGPVEGSVEVPDGKAPAAEVIGLLAGLDEAGAMFRQGSETVDDDREGRVCRGFSAVTGCGLGQIVDPEDRAVE